MPEDPRAPRDYEPRPPRPPEDVWRELEALLEQAHRVSQLPSARRGVSVLWAAVLAIVGVVAGSYGTVHVIGGIGGADPLVARRIGVDVHQAERALRDAEITAEVAQSIGAALAHGAVDCSVEWRTERGKLITRDRIRGHTDLDGRGLRYRLPSEPE